MPPHLTPIQVRFRDTDALGHVNNAAFATYIEIARLAFFKDVTGGSARRIGGDAGGLILARLELDFRRQVRLDDRVAVSTEVERLGRSSITLRQRVTAEGETAAEARTVIVTFDYDRQEPVPIPEDVRGALERL